MMGKKLKILAVCGFGVGTSLILKMNIEKVLKVNGIAAEVENADITTAGSVNADVIFTSKELYSVLISSVKVPLIQISNFLSNAEITEKGIPIIKELMK